MSKLIEQFIKEEYKSRTIPDFRVGDIVKVHQIVLDVKVEKKLSKTAKAIKKSQKDEKGPAQRIQVFEGVVIAKKHGTEPGATFTVRKIASHSVGVEKIFPLYSPLVKKIEVVSRPIKRVRQAKLYFLRERLGKRARRLSVGAAAEQERTEIGASAAQKAKIAEEERVAAEAKAAEEAETKVEEKAIMEAPTPLEEGRSPDSSEVSDDTEKK